MYIYIYVYICTYNLHLQAQAHAHVHVHVHAHVCIYIHMYMCMYTSLSSLVCIMFCYICSFYCFACIVVHYMHLYTHAKMQAIKRTHSVFGVVCVYVYIHMYNVSLYSDTVTHPTRVVFFLFPQQASTQEWQPGGQKRLPEQWRGCNSGGKHCPGGRLSAKLT